MSDPALAPPAHALLAPGVAENPHPVLHRLRAEDPVSWVPGLDGYLVTRHADIVAALKDRRLAPANLAQGLDRLSQAERDELAPVLQSVALWMGHTDEADHVRFQQLLKRYFTPATVAGLRPRVAQLTGELIDAVADAGRMDVVADLAYPLPANVIAEMLGMPTEERERLQAWSRDILALFAPADFEQLKQCQRSVLEMQDHLRGLVARRRVEPRDDLLSMFAAAEREGVVDEDEIVANCVLLLFAGHETTANLIANGLVLLFDHPDQFELLKSRRELMPTAVEEMLRCDGPANVILRVATEPVGIGGREVAAGQVLYLAMLAGNRDPEVFADPDRFDITRKPNRHTAFGLGAFYCLGAALARMEADVCFSVLLDRLPGLRPAYDRVDRFLAPPLNTRLETLEVAF
ncbi:cytochrome P450 [Saccharothrix australiensis]|uniref:Cytochrome P450 n=1 Tax=Saccharothrix australiensis TaxID=2072 RepID=A0A495W558_9PSEU|nr:cytochrome P450 [Saccharothrix australiensis]RKT54948.1 cytochrome P450 [Saccharothrix australiensis]